MSWITEVLLAVDRLGNALAGGESESTVSGRVGYYAYRKQNRFWLVLEAIIDQTFLPLHGPNHCAQAMTNDRDFKRGSDIGLALLSILVIAGCIVIWPIVRVIALWRKTNTAMRSFDITWTDILLSSLAIVVCLVMILMLLTAFIELGV